MRHVTPRPPFSLPLVALGALLVGIGAFAGCLGPQDEACVAYVACQRAYDEAFGFETPTDVSEYDDGGRCWVNEQTRQVCRDHCLIALEELRRAAREAGADIAACE